MGAFFAIFVEVRVERRKLLPIEWEPRPTRVQSATSLFFQRLAVELDEIDIVVMKRQFARLFSVFALLGNFRQHTFERCNVANPAYFKPRGCFQNFIVIRQKMVFVDQFVDAFGELFFRKTLAALLRLEFARFMRSLLTRVFFRAYLREFGARAKRPFDNAQRNVEVFREFVGRRRACVPPAQNDLEAEKLKVFQPGVGFENHELIPRAQFRKDGLRHLTNSVADSLQCRRAKGTEKIGTTFQEF